MTGGTTVTGLGPAGEPVALDPVDEQEYARRVHRPG